MEIYLLIAIIALLLFLFVTYRNPKKKISAEPEKQNLSQKNSTNITYEGSSKNTHRIYRIDVHFYPDEERCLLIFEGESYDFKRYKIGSEYEYKNDKGILRIKGDEALLVFPTGRVFQFKAIDEPSPSL